MANVIDDNSPPAPAPGPSPRRPSHTARRSRLPIVAGAIVVLAVAALAVWWFAIRDDDSGGPAADAPGVTEPGGAPTTAPPEPPDAEGEELLALLAAGRDLTFHATYRAEGDPAEIGGELTLELFRDEGRVRQDTRLESETGTALTSGIVVDGTAVVCSQRDNEDWICSETEASEEQRDGIFGIDRADLAGADVVASDAVIDGRSVRCFTYTRPDGDAEVCLTPEGIPVRSTAGLAQLVLVELEDEVADDAFDPPAEPAQADPQTSG